MKILYTEKKCNVWDSTKEYAEKKLKKFEKFFAGDCTVHVVFTHEKENQYQVEVTADYGGLVFRAQEISDDFKISIDKTVDVIIRQIRRHKTKLEKRLKSSDFSFDEPAAADVPEDTYTVSRVKSVSAKPMSDEEAILQMELVGHDFFVFRTEDGEHVRVVYRRKNGDYGVIEAD